MFTLIVNYRKECIVLRIAIPSICGNEKCKSTSIVGCLFGFFAELQV